MGLRPLAKPMAAGDGFHTPCIATRASLRIIRPRDVPQLAGATVLAVVKLAVDPQAVA
ncbi:hypothetical protein OS11_20890 [Dickeya oryzae]